MLWNAEGDEARHDLDGGGTLCRTVRALYSVRRVFERATEPTKKRGEHLQKTSIRGRRVVWCQVVLAWVAWRGPLEGPQRPGRGADVRVR